MAQRELSTTRNRILDAATHLFGVRGFDGTSAREITRVAETNVAAVHYHFGSKEAVLRGIIDRAARPISSRWTELLDSAFEKAEPHAPNIEALVEAFVRPDVEFLVALDEEEAPLAWLIGRTLSDPSPWIQSLARTEFAQARLFLPPMTAALPHLTPHELGWRFWQMVGVTINLFATWPATGRTVPETEALIERFVTYVSAGFKAPMPTLELGSET